MKFIISKTALEMAVKNICRVINPKNTLPIRDLLPHQKHPEADAEIERVNKLTAYPELNFG